MLTEIESMYLLVISTSHSQVRVNWNIIFITLSR